MNEKTGYIDQNTPDCITSEVIDGLIEVVGGF